MPDQILEKKTTQFTSQNLILFAALPSQNVKTYLKILHVTKRHMLWTRSSENFVEKSPSVLEFPIKKPEGVKMTPF